MKTRNKLKSAALVVSIAATLSTTISYAGVHSAADIIKAQPSSMYHATRGTPLADTLAQVAQRSGITFKINTDLGKDVVSQSIAADNWNIAVRSLLVNYNFTIIQDSETVKTVIISGRNNNAADTGTTTNNTTASADREIDIEHLLSIIQMEPDRSIVQ